MQYPQDLSYSQEYMWTRTNSDDGSAEVGITEDFIESVGEISSIDLPLAGDELDMDHLCIHLHMRSNLRHLRSPLSGRVLEVNKDVLDNPNLLHVAPYKQWLYRMEFDEPDELDMLMSSKQYARYLDSL